MCLACEVQNKSSLGDRLDRFVDKHGLVRYKFNLANFSSSEELHRELYRFGKLKLKEGDLFAALDAFIYLNDKKRVKQIGKRCLSNKEQLCDAGKAFEFEEDKNSFFKVIRVAEKAEPEILDGLLWDYIDHETRENVNSAFIKWASEKVIKDPYGFKLHETLNMAYNLSDKYDIGVGIARGGLYSAFIFGLLGLKTKIAHSHRKGRGTTFNWAEDILPRELEGKSLVVFDNDVISGRTTKRVLEELLNYRPQNVDIVLNLNPVSEVGLGIGSKLSNIDSRYGKIYYPKKFNYNSFDKAVQRLEQKIVK